MGSEGILNRLMELSRTAALAEMASGIAHELNQPLGAIATFGEAGDRLLNRAEPLVPRAREVFQHISAEARNAGEGIRRIRRLFDHAEPTRIRCQMSELVGELVPALQAMARAAHVSLKVDAQSPLPEVNVDRLRIQLVLFSLVQNAIEASTQDGRGSGSHRGASGSLCRRDQHHRFRSRGARGFRRQALSALLYDQVGRNRVGSGVKPCQHRGPRGQHRF